MLALVVANGIIQIGSDDRIPVAHGFGYDGQQFAALARNLPAELRREGMGNERTQRILPSAVLYCAFNALGLRNVTDDQVVRSFQLLNLWLLILSVLIWSAIARHCQLKPLYQWLGFAALLCNYPNAKMCYYYATLTDVTSFFLGMLVFLLALRGHWFATFFTLMIGAWGSSTLIPWFAPLLVLRQQPLEPAENGKLPLVATTLIALTYATLVLVSIYVWKFFPPAYFAPLWLNALPVSLLLGVAYLFVAVPPLLKFRFVQALTDRRWRTLIHWEQLIAVVAAAFLVSIISDGISGSVEGQGLIRKTLIKGNSIPVRSIAKPWIFLVAHAAYFGPIVVVAALFWRKVCRTIGEYGVGFILFTLLTLAFGLSSESRHHMIAFPPLVAVVCITCQRLDLGRWFTGAFWLFSIFASRLWMILGTDWSIADHPLSYPAQYFHLGSGPWLAPEMYWVQVGYVAIAAIVFSQLCAGRRDRR